MAAVQALTPAALLSSAWSTRGSLQGVAILGHVALLGHWRAGLVLCIRNEMRMSNLMHSCTHEACSPILKTVPVKSAIVSPFFGLISSSSGWSFDPYYPLSSCKRELEERLCLFTSSLIASISGLFKLWWKHSESVRQYWQSRDGGESSCKPSILRLCTPSCPHKILQRN